MIVIRKILLWLRIVRPQTLFASLCPVLVGLIVVAQAGVHPDEPGAVATVLCALALQVLSNLINDLYDYRRGADKAGRKGFRRALAEGEVSEKQMKVACYITLAIALLLGLYLVLRGGWVILMVGLSALLFAWLYTATSHSLSYLGIADIFVWLYYGVVATMGTIWLQLPYDEGCYGLLRQGFWAGSVCGLVSMSVLMINNLRDMEDDHKAGKHTLPVRIGKHPCEWVMLVTMVLAVGCAYMAFGGWVAGLMVLPLGGLWWMVRHAVAEQYNPCLLATGLINALYVLLAAVVG